ncbi:Hypothetical predicted protein [Olea europaea subsp. europaea]|uniref:Uncharacterized protein n=1 Tax=Olea europaea subsp. europaea TaxID=158383 RepID=A0A8S0PZW1_OLEEU|nr:Hypothetical predicted protein [Olea europaea subsp. europaea]
MGLSLMLLRLSHGRMPKDGYRMEDLDDGTTLTLFLHRIQEERAGKAGRELHRNARLNKLCLPFCLLHLKRVPSAGLEQRQGTGYLLLTVKASPFILNSLIQNEVPTAAIREILIVFLPVLLPAEGRTILPTRTGEGQTLGRLPGFSVF